jgi:hypothetical protein
MLVRPEIVKAAPNFQTRPRRRSKPKIRNGVNLSALQAITAARAFIAGAFSTLDAAALAHGSHRNAVAAAVTLLKIDAVALTYDVLTGRKPLMRTARSVKNAADMVTAFQRASNEERKLFGRAVSPETIFDAVICAAL